MARTRDPLRNFAYRVTIDQFDAALGFSSVDGLNQTVEVVEYREGGDPFTARKMPGQASYDNIVLERGKYTGVGADEFMLWAQQVMNINEPNQNNDGFRRDVTITIIDRAGAIVRTYVAKDGWVCDYQHETLSGDGNEVWIQRMEICHEGLIETNLQ